MTVKTLVLNSIYKSKKLLNVHIICPYSGKWLEALYDQKTCSSLKQFWLEFECWHVWQMSHRSGWLVLRPELVDFSVDTRLNLKKYGQLETSTNAHWSLVRLIKHIFLCPQKPQGSFPTWWIKIIRLRCLRNFLDLFEAQHLLVAAISNIHPLCENMMCYMMHISPPPLKLHVPCTKSTNSGLALALLWWWMYLSR